VGNEGPDASAPACDLVHPPQPPLLSGPPGSGDFTVALWHEDFGDSLDAGMPYMAIGYDLDDACTSQDGGHSCLEPTWAKADHTDGPHGRDNAMGALLYQAHLHGGGSLTDLVYSGTVQGKLQLAIRVRGYGQLSDQGVVDVAYYSVTIHPGPDGGASPPTWKGTDAWDVVPPEPSEAGPDVNLDQAILAEDKAAYVTGGSLVSKLDGLTVGSVPQFHLVRVTVTADIVQSGDKWVLKNGIIAGRLAMSEVLRYLAFTRDPSSPTNFCQDAGSYPVVKAFACSYADIGVGGTDDGSQLCDGVSWSWRFTDTAAITLAGTWHGPPFQTSPPADCAPGQSPLDDRCDR
jgi:hypothetical protein